jgi:hypothetical protein
LLQVGHADGTINSYDLASGAPLLRFATRPGLSQVLALRRFKSLAAVHVGTNAMQLWDLLSDRALQVRND